MSWHLVDDRAVKIGITEPHQQYASNPLAKRIFNKYDSGRAQQSSRTRDLYLLRDEEHNLPNSFSVDIESNEMSSRYVALQDNR